MHIVHGQLRKAPYVKAGVGKDGQSTMFAVELSEMIKDYKTGEKTYTNYKAILFAASDAHVAHYMQTLVEGNFIVITAEKLKVEVSECGQYIKLYMDNARLEGSGYIPQGQQQQAPARQAPQQQGGYSQQAPQQQGGFANQAQQQHKPQQQQQAPKVNPQEPTIDFDDDIPF